MRQLSALIGGLPEVPGLLGGFSLYREFSDWYRGRDESVRHAVLPGFGGIEKGFGDILVGEKGENLLGERVAFVSAFRDDAGTEKGTEIRLPGFAFLFDGPNSEAQREGFAKLFAISLAEIEKDGDSSAPVEDDWRLEKESFSGVEMTVAHYRKDDAEGLDVELPVVPAMAEVAGRCVISSSRKLCRDIIATLQKGDLETIENRDLFFDLRLAELAEFMTVNRGGYEKVIMREGRTAAEAKRDVEHILGMLDGIESIHGSTTAESGAFELAIRSRLR